MPGSSVIFQIYQDLAVATSPLTETVDPDAVAVSPTTTVSVTLREYGNPVITTRKLNLFALSDVDPAVANIVAYNMADSVDVIVREVLSAGTNQVKVAGGVLTTTGAGTLTDIAEGDTLSSALVRWGTAKLRTDKVVPVKGDLYGCYLHPFVSADLRSETGAAAWRDPHNYSAAGNIWAGEIGAYEGAFFVESPRTKIRTGAGSLSADVYDSYFHGRQALAEATAEEFHTVVGPVTDKLMRLRPIGWYGVAGWSLYRPASLLVAHTGSETSTA